MKVIIVNGRGGVGKDSFVNFFTETAGKQYVLNISTVDYIKDVARELGWRGDKDNLSRKFLSDLKDMATYWADKPFQDVLKRTEIFYNELQAYGVEDNGFVFIHCREPKEIQRIKESFPYLVFTLLIRRAGDKNYGNHADDEVENYNYDFYIDNNSSLTDLSAAAQKFYNHIK